MAWFDGGQWHGNTKISNMPGGISPKSRNNPGLAVFQDKLYIVYRGENHSQLYFASFDGHSWSGNTQIGAPKSSHSPGATVFQNKLYIAYRGENGADLYTAWFDGQDWAGNVKIRDQQNTNITPKSADCPNATVYNGQMYLIYRGENGTDLYTAWFNGQGWAGNVNMGRNSDTSPRIATY